MNSKESAVGEALAAPIPVFKPSYGDEELEAVRECLSKGWTGCGPKVKEFEDAFARYLGMPYAVATNSCTASLHLALTVLDVQGFEVISTPLTFVSTNHAILYNGAVPVFADIEPGTLNIDPASVERQITSRTKAVMAVHYGGQACQMDRLRALAYQHGLALVEDCAHACGGSLNGQKLGTFGDIACFSFHAVKNLATGDGGMIVTRDEKVYRRLMKLRWVGISRDTWNRAEAGSYSWDYNVEETGFKYQMNDITAAIGLVQLAKLEAMNEKRRSLAGRYREALGGIAGLELLEQVPGAESAQHNFVIKTARRDELMEFLRVRGISGGVHYRPNNHYPMYESARGQTPAAERVWKTLLTLPLFPALTDEQFRRVVEAVKSFFRS